MPADLAQLYEEKVRDFARKVRNDRRLNLPNVTFSRTSPLCGSRLTLDFRLDGDRINDIGWMARACILGMASTAVFVEAAPGASAGAAAVAGRCLERFLQGEETDFPARWEALTIFRAARALSARHGSILLPFRIADALAEAMPEPE